MRNEEEERNVGQPGEEHNGDEQIDVEQNMVEVDDEEPGVEVQIDVALTEKDKELERFFNAELEQLNHSTALQMEPREKLPKVKLDAETHERANKILNCTFQILTPFSRLLIWYMPWEKLLRIRLE